MMDILKMRDLLQIRIYDLETREAKKGKYTLIFEEVNSLNQGNIKVYTKLPYWFKIPTPLGHYNPDWAILVEDPNQNKEKLYFIVETKGTTFEEGIRGLEDSKIECGRKHFEALEVDYSVYAIMRDFKDYIEKIKEKNIEF